MKLFAVSMILSGVVISAGYVYADEMPLKEKAVSNTVYKSKRGSITVERYKPTADYPRFRILSPHYEIYSEIKETTIPPQELGMIMEAIYEQMTLFYGAKVTKSGRMGIEVYANQARFNMHCPGYNGANGVFLTGKDKAYTYYLDFGPVWWTRALMIHETSHQFHALSGAKDGKKGTHGGSKFPFIVEGVATFVEGHRWDVKTETMVIGAPLPGRSAHGFTEMKAHAKTYDECIAANLERDEAFNLLMFLIHCKPKEAEKLLRDTRDPKMAWKDAFGTTQMPESFWKEYMDFQEKISRESTLANNEGIQFKGWKPTSTNAVPNIPMDSTEKK